MAAPSNSTLLTLTDSVAQAVSDFNANIAGASGVSTGATTINTGFGGQGASQTLGRVLAYADYTSENTLAAKLNNAVANVAAYMTGVQSMNAFYQQLWPFLDAFDAYLNANVTTGGVNAWLTAQAFQVNAWFANAFNNYVSNAIGAGLRTSANAPASITTANYFPYAVVDPMYGFNVTGASASTNTAGSASSTKGGGVATIYIYKSNATAPVGGATFTITYTNAAGVASTVQFTTTSSVPGASGSIGSGSVSLGVQAQAVTGVAITGGTSGENYAVGAKLVRAAGY